MRVEIRLAGVGGQGLIVAGTVLGEAAALHDGLYAVQTQAYAPLARGAPTRSDVIISDTAIAFPQVELADILVALAPHALQAHAGMVVEGGLLLVDGLVPPGRYEADPRLLALPLAHEAALAGATRGGAAVVALAVVARACGCVSDEALRLALRPHTPPDSHEANLAALERGFALWESHGRLRLEDRSSSRREVIPPGQVC